MKITTFNISTDKKVLDTEALGCFDILALQEVHESIAQLLIDSLSNYSCRFTNNNPSKSNYGLFTAVDKKHVVLNFEEVEIIPDGAKLLDRDKKRYVQLYKIQGYSGVFNLVNLHLPVYKLCKQKLMYINKFLDRIAEERVVILGDFNFTSILGSNKSFLSYMLGQGYTNAVTVKNTRKGFMSTGQVDYIFYKGFCNPINCKIIEGLSSSDHYPVTCELDF